MKKTLSVLIIAMAVCFAACDNEHSGPVLHEDITVTLFWVGEEANEENGYIQNLRSVWDDRWMEHYGGVDDPDNRNGYRPAGFTPLENPFYFALPYNDFGAGGWRRSSAYDDVFWADDQEWGELESMCKNQWIEITKVSLTAYAQWEDAGPFGENDSGYVFGDALPRNLLNNRAGLDVSPAVRDYMGLEDIDTVDWQFVDSEEVPDGPWKEIVTTSQIYWE